MADPVENRAHELYWSSDRSVNSIAEELGLSKGRLYEAVRPTRAGRTCPDCGSDLVFENRTARDQDDPACPMCDGTQSPLPRSGPAASGPDPGSSDHPPSEPIGAFGGLLVGVALGVILGRFFRR